MDYNNKETYLGDNVWVTYAKGHIRLTTVGQRGPTNTVYLSKENIDVFFRYLEKMMKVKIEIKDI